MVVNIWDYLKPYARLTKNEVFVGLKSHEERIRFILESVRPLAQFRQELYQRTEEYTESHRKSIEKTNAFIEEALEFQSKRNYSSAHFLFTKAILSAPFPTQGEGADNALSLAFAYKSVAEFELKDYESALSSANFSLQLFETIEMFLHRIYCLRLLRKFDEALEGVKKLIKAHYDNPRSLDCAITIQGLLCIKNYITRQMSNNFDRTSMDLHPIDIDIEEEPEAPLWLHPSCQINFSDRKGRHFIAKDYIPPNTVLLVETPTSTVLYDDFQKKYCSYCLKNIDNLIYPCSGCDEVVFCDRNCLAKGIEGSHGNECGISGLLIESGHSIAHTFQLISKVGPQKAFDCEEQNDLDFNQYIESLGTSTDNSNTQYEGFYSLISHNSEYDKYSNIYQSLRAIETALYFDYKNQLDFDVEEDFNKFIQFSVICLKSSRKVLANVHGWVSPKEKDNGKDIPIKKRHVGSCVCNVSSLFNHNCEPNVYWRVINAKMYYTSRAPIERGMEVNISYGPTAKMPFRQRHLKLKTYYFFDCSCEACLRDCKSTLCAKCNHCSGPVVYSLPIGSYFYNRGSHCLQCGQQMENFNKIVKKIEGLKYSLEHMLKNLENKHDVESSLFNASLLLNELLEVVYSESQPLMNWIRQMAKYYHSLKRSEEAVKYVDHFDIAINKELNANRNTLSPEVFEDLVLVTDCYHQYLINKRVSDAKHWDLCFNFYSKLIGFLKRSNACIKEEDETQEDDTQDHTTSDQKVMSDQTIRSYIKDKKEELKQLKEWYQLVLNEY